MSTSYDGVVSATFKNLNIDHSGPLNSFDSYMQICQSMTTHVASMGEGVSDLASRGTEYHSFGVSGWTGGEFLAPMLWSIGHLGHFFAKLTNVKTGLLMTSFADLLLASDYLETVYTPNTTSNKLYNDAIGGTTPENIHNISWSEIAESLPQLDFAHVAIFHFADRQICEAVTKAIKPGGVLVLANSSNGGELYNKLRPYSFAQEVHDEIHMHGSFTSFHLQGYVSYTLFIKNS